MQIQELTNELCKPFLCIAVIYLCADASLNIFVRLILQQFSRLFKSVLPAISSQL